MHKTLYSHLERAEWKRYGRGDRAGGRARLRKGRHCGSSSLSLQSYTTLAVLLKNRVIEDVGDGGHAPPRCGPRSQGPRRSLSSGGRTGREGGSNGGLGRSTIGRGVVELCGTLPRPCFESARDHRR